MFTNILLASDGSARALKAAAAAATLASKFMARLIIINVFQPIPAYGPFREVVNSDLHEQYVRELQEHAISPAGRIMEGMGVPY
jgi:nucleotide-binding universal stress UspA family protein